MESFTSRCNISTTPCGHVFHTFCIENWLSNGRNRCSQCRRICTKDQITKLYFSEASSENNLILELEEENLKLREDANESKRQVLKLEEEKLKWQQEKLKLKQTQLRSQEENVRLSKHIDDLRSKWNEEKKTLKAQISSLDFNPELSETSTDSNSDLPTRSRQHSFDMELLESDAFGQWLENIFERLLETEF